MAQLDTTPIESPRPMFAGKHTRQRSRDDWGLGSLVQLGSAGLFLSGLACLLTPYTFIYGVAAAIFGLLGSITGTMMLRHWICSACGNRVEKTSRLCPCCKSRLE